MRPYQGDYTLGDRILALLLIGALIACAAALLAPTADGQDTSGLDLPVPPARYGEPYRNAPRPNEPADDPRDTPPPVFYGEEIDLTGDSLVYVLDRSGSMVLGTPWRWERARREARHSIAGLPDSMRFDVYVYGGTIEGCWQELRPATDEAKSEASAWLEGFGPSGGTPTSAAMAQALSDHRDCKSFILLTDGMPNAGPRKCRELIRGANHQGAQIDVFGIEASGTYRAFCQGVAADSGGSYFDVP